MELILPSNQHPMNHPLISQLPSICIYTVEYSFQNSESLLNILNKEKEVEPVQNTNSNGDSRISKFGRVSRILSIFEKNKPEDGVLPPNSKIAPETCTYELTVAVDQIVWAVFADQPGTQCVCFEWSGNPANKYTVW